MFSKAQLYKSLGKMVKLGLVKKKAVREAEPTVLSVRVMCLYHRTDELEMYMWAMGNIFCQC